MGGHDAEFEAFFRAEFPSLVGALSVAVGRDEAADVVQEAFVRANARWGRVRRMDHPAAWVRRVALNLVTDDHRKRLRRRRLDPLLDVRTTCVQVPEDRDLAEALAALPPRQRLAVVLHYLVDLPIHQVAFELGVTEGTVKATLHRARASLRAKLEVIGDG
jgi:RNA polymerase sigma-70 factor (ECF subfamily)